MKVVERPWGTYQVLYSDPTNWLKLITVMPGQMLSYQHHKNRDEFWLPQDKGLSALVAGWKYNLLPNAVYTIPRGRAHRLINDTAEPHSLIEWAVGKVDEDDIVRLDDMYGR